MMCNPILLGTLTDLSHRTAIDQLSVDFHPAARRHRTMYHELKRHIDTLVFVERIVAVLFGQLFA